MTGLAFMLRALPALVPILLAGCATITRGPNAEVSFTSEPPGAVVEVTEELTCTTPCTLTISRKTEFTAVFKLDGFAEQSIEVKTRLAGAGAAGLAGNLLVGGIVGVGADAMSGATLEHYPDPVHAVMEPE